MLLSRPFVSLYRKIHRKWKQLPKDKNKYLLKMNV
ncbi:hypothetical protein EVA_17535 [gut metagenome]|uniref:Uncharacterized protein n=1 Tax=gut metagenome TaxID=749906 RepID=J9FIU4_9ZZZZ